MRLSLVNDYNKRYEWRSSVYEGYGRTYEFDYHGNQVTDQRPKAMSLGRWRSGRGNNLMAGINLNYLSPEQIKRLQQNLQPILRNRNLRSRARALRRLMPDIFNSAYRTYYNDAVDNVEPGTLKFLARDRDADQMDVPRPQTAPNASVDADDVEAPQMDTPDPDRAPSAGDVSDKIRARHDRMPKQPEQPRQPEQPEIDPEPENIGSDEIEPEEPEDLEDEET